MSFFGYKEMNTLSSVELSIYRYIIDNDEKIPFMRVREIADASHTSTSSVMRFIRKVGYDSFPEFKIAFKKELAEQQGESADYFDQQFDSLNRSKFPKDLEERIRTVGEILTAADNIVFLGMGASGAICDYAARRMANLGVNAFSIKDPSYPLFMRLKKQALDIIIVLSVSGKTNELIEMVNGFKNKPDKIIITITGDETSSLARMAEYVLPYKNQNQRVHIHHDLSSQLPSIFILEALIQEVDN